MALNKCDQRATNLVYWRARVSSSKSCCWTLRWSGWNSSGSLNSDTFDLEVKRVNCEIRPGRPNGPIGESKMPTSTRPKKVGPILSHGPPVRTKTQTCPSRFKRLVLQAREACPTSLRGLFSRSERLAQQVCEACSASLWGLLCKERRQDLTTIKRPKHPQKRYV